MSTQPAVQQPTLTTAPGHACGIATRLVEQGILSAAAAHRADREARTAELSLMQYLIESGLVTPRQAAVAAAWEYGLPLLDLDALRLERLPAATSMPTALLRKLGVLPLQRSERMVSVAVPYPATLAKLDELQFALGLPVEGVLVPVDQLQPAMESYLNHYQLSQADGDSLLAGLSEAQYDDNAVSTPAQEYTTDSHSPSTGSGDAPVMRFVDQVLLDAIRRGASDIHLEPYENSYRIRLRVDGMLFEAARPPFAMRSRIAARLKVMARLDISERRLPQDGAITLRLSEQRSVDFRISTLPTVYGEKLVLRVLDSFSAQLGIEALGFTPQQLKLYSDALAAPQGMVLVTGPTGSGKTMTLYSGLERINTSERNIATAEDPVELKVPGINQLNVQPKIGLDFANALRAFLRQDPDVVMVGEIRDLETADIAVKASQTGHLVLSTLHTRSAAGTLTRLTSMGVAPFNVASAVSLIIAQRLARTLCPHCKEPAQIPAETLHAEGFSEQQIAQATLFQAVGCRHCTQGYKGRMGIYELVPISAAISQLIMRNGNALELDKQARREGHPDLRHSGLLKVVQGVTSLAEINRVTGT